MQGFFVAGPFDDGDPVTGHYYETAANDPGRPQVWGYAGAISYRPGDTLRLHAMASAPEAHLTITRDGLSPQTVLETRIPTSFAATPADCSVKGCGWPVAFEAVIPQDWPTGVYTVTLDIEGHSSEGLFVLKPAAPTAKLAIVLTTGTWCAYNDWGGSNHYQGLTGPSGRDFAAEVSLLRPWATGFVRWPADAPRIPFASPLLTRPRYPHMDTPAPRHLEEIRLVRLGRLRTPLRALVRSRRHRAGLLCPARPARGSRLSGRLRSHRHRRA